MVGGFCAFIFGWEWGERFKGGLECFVDLGLLIPYLGGGSGRVRVGFGSDLSGFG